MMRSPITLTSKGKRMRDEILAKYSKEKKMKEELKLYRITIATRVPGNEPSNELDDGCEMMVLGTDGEDVCAKILDEMPDSPFIPPSRITITEMKGPFEHGYIIAYHAF